jgi:hypothetical protein
VTENSTTFEIGLLVPGPNRPARSECWNWRNHASGRCGEYPLCGPFPPFGQQPLSAQLRRPRPRSATSAKRRLCGKTRFCLDHNLNGHRRPSRKIRQGFGRAGDVAPCDPPISLIVTITRAEEVWRAKSRFSRPVILRVFPHNPSIPVERHVPDDHLLRKIDGSSTCPRFVRTWVPTIATSGAPRLIPS